MGIEASGLGALDILLHAKTGQRHRRCRFIFFPDLLNKIKPGGVGQTKVAYEKIKRITCGRLQCCRDSSNALHFESAVLQEPDQGPRRFSVIFDQ